GLGTDEHDRSTWPRRAAGVADGRVAGPAAASVAASPAAVPWATSATTTQQPMFSPQQVAAATAGVAPMCTETAAAAASGAPAIADSDDPISVDDMPRVGTGSIQWAF
ncbi:unnamed protein product, partial [Phaeothamnion confervicola]